jgi:hypothetical protein
LAASADKLDASGLLHPPSGGSGVVHTAPFFCLKFSHQALPDQVNVLRDASFGL